ncbi:MAG: gamma-glutamyl-gamma-aminobutyrate hydrolase family protein [Verrucomicrobia subdivision 3 bacterium]|nr:gamma-glutamyl-gamma-aminobutyrate hydrolase family protein [Limisphaerales bacterium]
MKRAPLIVVSTMTEQKGAEFRDRSTSLSFWYTRAIARAGGLPLLAPNFPEQKNLARDMVARADGVMLTGGDDLQPELYDPALPCHIKTKAGGVDPARDLFEFQLIEQALQQRKPILAICRGPQVLNVALGGGLVTDIPTELPRSMNHARKGEAHKRVHSVQLSKGSLMRKIFRHETLRINSAHHQAVGELAPMLRATAQTKDGIIEAIELSETEAQDAPFLLGVQFHPERLIDTHPEFLRVFKAFVKACA